uniref:Putative secreted protein n=1 Tax=Xenopsylla cheopis TaxID=163159 RepID=A0A6M2DZ97_XENCH
MAVFYLAALHSLLVPPPLIHSSRLAMFPNSQTYSFLPVPAVTGCQSPQSCTPTSHVPRTPNGFQAPSSLENKN